jgi:MFS family permease
MSVGEKIVGGMSNEGMINILLIGVAGMGLVIGLSFPLVTLSLERLNFDSGLIGLNTATGSIGILVVGVYTGRLLAKHSAFAMILGAYGVAIATLLLMPLTESVSGWFALRFFEALGLGFLWLVSETWVNELASPEKRGRVMGMYGMAFSIGFATGPLLVTLIGSEGMQPFVITAAILVVSSPPMIMLAGKRKAIDEHETRGHIKVLRLGLFLFMIAFAAGFFESIVFALMLIYTHAEGLGDSSSLYALSALSAGGIAMQYPMGRFADIFGRYALMVVIAVGILLSVIAIPYVLDSFILLLVVLFIFGGSIFGLYILGLILLGDEFGSSSLVVANAVFIIMYDIGGIIGPPITGMAMDIWPQSGFIGTLVVSAILFCVVTFMRRKA